VTTASISAALETLAGLISEDPSKARAKAVPATARLLEGLRCEITGSKGAPVYTDMPAAMGGAASAHAPGWLFRAAIASCAATTIAMRAARVGLSLSVLEITVDSESDQRGILGLDERVSAGFTSMRMRVKIGAEGADPAQLRELVEWGDAHSPVGCTVRRSPLSEIEIEVV